MRSLIPAKSFLFKLSYLKSPLSKSSLRNFKRAYILGKSLFFKSFNTIRLRTKHLTQKFNFHVMTSLRSTTCIAVSIQETTNEAKCIDSVSTSGHPRRSSKEEKEKSRKNNCKESIKCAKDVKVENRRPVSFTIKPKNPNPFAIGMNQKNYKTNKCNENRSTLINPFSNITYKRYSNVHPTYSNFTNHTVASHNNVLPGYVHPSSSTSFQFPNYLYHSLSDFQMNNRVYSSNAAEYSNSTRASMFDKQQAVALRSWQRTPLGKTLDKSVLNSTGCIFKIMSYNVLAQELLDQHTYLYQYHNPNAIIWDQRWFTLLEELKHHNADILCLQEVQASHVETYYNQLYKLGYKGIFKQRTGGKTDGCAIYYKHSVFKLVEHATVEFKQTDGGVLNRDNVAIIAKFAPRTDKQNEFVVSTTHLLYNPRREDVRLAQIQVLLSEIDRLAYKPNYNNQQKHVPIIITGDLNILPESPVYKLLTSGHLKYDHLTEKSLSTENSSYSNVTGKKLLPAFLRITDQCQHANIVERRLQNSDLNREDELKLLQLQHSERKGTNRRSKYLDESLFATGTLTHNFVLKSAYLHNYGNDTEATTYQNKWVTVDYIFYSGKLNDSAGLHRDAKLKLLSRYKLPSTQQLEGVRIPNYALGSDHLLLLVTFKLEP